MKHRPPLVTLPAKVEYCLFLIREELKSRHLFNRFQELGFENYHLEPSLDRLILKHVGLDDGMDETMTFYINVMARRIGKIGEGNESAMKQAVKVYVELVGESSRRKAKLKP